MCGSWSAGKERTHCYFRVTCCRCERGGRHNEELIAGGNTWCCKCETERRHSQLAQYRVTELQCGRAIPRSARVLPFRRKAADGGPQAIRNISGQAHLA